MKHILLLTLLLALFASCKKDGNMYGVDCSENKTKAIQEEVDSIGRYLEWRNVNGANIEATLHPNGFYYIITDIGEGDRRPETCSAINVDYKGRRFGGSTLEGNVFDEREGASFSLYTTIAGWQQAIPLIGQGGRIEVYIPPSLAYGEKSSGSLGPNSYLFFEITLNTFN